jgi:hypothetical protein
VCLFLFCYENDQITADKIYPNLINSLTIRMITRSLGASAAILGPCIGINSVVLQSPGVRSALEECDAGAQLRCYVYWVNQARRTGNLTSAGLECGSSVLASDNAGNGSYRYQSEKFDSTQIGSPVGPFTPVVDYALYRPENNPECMVVIALPVYT